MSNFRPDTRGRRWSLVQVHLFSPAAGREGRCRQISLACVGSTRSVRPHWVCPAHGCVLSPSIPLRLRAAVPVFGYSTKAWPQLGLRFVPSLSRAAQAARSLRVHFSRVQCAFSPLQSQPQFPCVPVGCLRLVSVLRSWPLAATLLADVDHPESQDVFG